MRFLSSHYMTDWYINFTDKNIIRGFCEPKYCAPKQKIKINMSFYSYLTFRIFI